MPSYAFITSFLLLALSGLGAASSSEFAQVKRSELIRLQTGTRPVVAIGDSNPPIAAAQVNPIGDVTPLAGDGGQLQNFKRQTGTQPVFVVGASNPPIDPNDVNPIGDVTPLIGDGGNFVDFSSSLVPNAANDRMVRRSNVNMISHDIATRGLPGGIIQIIEARAIYDDDDEE